MDYNTRQKDINNEVHKLVANKWEFLEMSWPIIEHKYKHRSEIKSINEMDMIKNNLKNKVGYIAVFYFLNILYTNKEYPGPYLEVEKGLFLIYHLTSGISGRDINRHLPQSSFFEFYKRFWMESENYKRINKIVNESLSQMCSTLKLRILSAHQKNPILFKHVTLLLDGHDSRINYVNTNIKKEKLYSYKLKKSGVRTQFMTDVNDMILYISKSDFCSDSSDGSMFLNMQLYNKIKQNDVLALDGGYTLFIK